MSTQSINLLPILCPPEPVVYLPLVKLKRYLLWFVGVLLLISIFALWSGYTQQKSMQRVAQKRASLAAQVKKIKTVSPGVIDTALEKKVAALASEVENKSKLIELLASEHRMDTRGYSSAMQALAETVPDGLWLTRFDLGDRGVSLKGKTMRALLVPRFASLLKKTPAFSQTPFKDIDVAKKKDNGQAIHFELATSEDVVGANS